MSRPIFRIKLNGQLGINEGDRIQVYPSGKRVVKKIINLLDDDYQLTGYLVFVDESDVEIYHQG